MPENLFISKWDKRFLELSRVVGSWSKDPSSGVGCVITDQSNRIVSVGFNGFARGVSDYQERYNNRALKYPLVIHAEINAILFAKRDLKGCTLYCSAEPCTRCASTIIQSGITKVVCPNASTNIDFYSRWKEEIELTRIIFSEAKVVCIYEE